jgi:hypothetical protein
LTALPGCWSGHLFEAGRRRETVVRYERAFLVGERLRLDYSVEVRNRRGEPLRREQRSASVALAALAARPELPVDAVPVEVSRRLPEPAGEPVALARGASEAAAAATPLVLAIRHEDGSDVGFTLRRAHPEEDLGQLRSGALVRDRTAPWVYPLLPFSAALDVAVVPLHVLGVGFFLVTPE